MKMSGRVSSMRMALNRLRSSGSMRISTLVVSISLPSALLVMAALLSPGVTIVEVVIMTVPEQAAAMMSGRVF